MKRFALGWLVACGLTPLCQAHDGPPYPILVDEAFGESTLSVWADPDVGVGTFYIYLPDERIAGDLCERITGWSKPLDGHLAETSFTVQPAEAGAPYQGIATVDYDARGSWHVRFVLDAPQTQAEIAADIDVTPPGAGRIDLLWFLTPFLLVAFLWGKAIHQRATYSPASQ